MQSFSIGTAGFEPHRPPTTLPPRRIGLTCPSRPPAPNEDGSSNWSASVGGTGAGSPRIGTSSFVGFSIANGSGGISFGGGGSESLAFSFSSGGTQGTGFGLGGHNGQDMTYEENTTGIGGNESTIGYRGVGYNQNFAHADEYPPSQEHVETQKEPIDLNVMMNKETRRQYCTDDKRHIYAEILARNGTGKKLKHGVSKAVALACDCRRRIVQRVWQEAKKGGGITGVKNNRKLKSGRKKKILNIDALEAIPPGERTTLEQAAGHLNLSTTTVWRRLRTKEIRRITSELKPALTDANQRARLEYALMYFERCSITALGGINPTFRADMDVVHIDEKWFYRTRKTQNMYLSHREEAPQRECKNKNHIQKIMFLSAMARPRYDAQGNCVFDGKIGVWAYTEWVQAKKRSSNRLRGAWELKPADKVDREKSREYLVKYVLPAIKEKWPESDR
ncbi:transposon mariner sub-class [Hordeum vulgare]|nr:transposon mariner sub-class [Hordeum vulgare]